MIITLYYSINTLFRHISIFLNLRLNELMNLSALLQEFIKCFLPSVWGMLLPELYCDIQELEKFPKLLKARIFMNPGNILLLKNVDEMFEARKRAIQTIVE